MPFDFATGVYTPATGAETAAPGQLIQSTVWNNIFTDISTALTAVQQAIAISITAYGAVAGGSAATNATAIQSALDSGIGAVYVPTGIFSYSTQLTIPDTVGFFFGPGTLKYTGGDNTDAISISDFAGNLIIYGITFDFAVSLTNMNVIVIGGASSKIQIDSCWFKNCIRTGITFFPGTASDLTFTNNRFDSLNQGAIQVYSTVATGSNVSIKNNRIYCNRTNINGGAIYVLSVEGVQICGNFIDRSYGFGIQVDNCLNALISNNVIQNNLLEAIRIDSSVSGTMSDWIVDNNIVAYPDVAGSDYGIGVGAFAAASINRNGIVSNNSINNPGSAGIDVAAYTTGALISDISIQGNRVINPNQLNNPNSSAIAIAPVAAGTTVSRCTVRDNTIYANNGFMPYGVQEFSPASSNRILDNAVEGFSSGPVFVTSTSSIASGNSPPQAPVIQTTSFSVDQLNNSYICNGTAGITSTLPSPSGYNTGRVLTVKTVAAQVVVSPTANVVALATTAAVTAILSATAGKWAQLQANGVTQWIIIAGN